MAEKAKHWHKNRWLYLVLGAVIITVFFSKAYSLFQNLKKEYYTPYTFTVDDISGEVAADEWFVFKLNEFAMFFDNLHKMRCLDLIEGMICIMGFSCGLAQITLVVMRWNNGPRDLALAKVLQANFNLWKERNDTAP